MLGNSGWLAGVQFKLRSILSARRKFRKRLATSRSCRKSRWKSGLGRTFHAMVSVMAVKIQFSSLNID